jgi:hypothetical protein
MRRQEAKVQKAKARAAAKMAKGPKVAFKRKNYLLLGAALLTIIAGFVLLRMGSTRVAPLLLVAGYCVLVPLALLLK